MCNCEKELEEKLLKHKPNMEKVEHPTMAYGMEGIIYYTPYELKKDTVTKTGKKRVLKETVNVFWKYCPYCGEKLD